MINREIGAKIKKAINGERKVIIIYGPRQAGKTTLIKHLLSEIKEDFEYFTGDDLYAQNIFSKNELESLRKIIKSGILVIDEAQRIASIGLSLKLIFDNLPVKVITSGSASFELADKNSWLHSPEGLWSPNAGQLQKGSTALKGLWSQRIGRTKTFWLYPLAFSEVEYRYRKTATETALEEMLLYGMYPKVHELIGNQDKENYLYEYLNNYLYKDILSFAGVRKPKKVVDLLTLLALQIGGEVKISELAQNLSISQKAVENYLDVLEKMFVLLNLRGFSRNLRKEISKTSKYYFFDVGLRNALIRNFNPLNLRSDAGELFENWFVMEKIKAASIFERPANFYFWRTYDRQEIDLIEERAGKLFGYEVKWNKAKAKKPLEWLRAYDNSRYEIVNNENYQEFLI